jgi:crotonobetainyl-CoA:carnitine CoA-transferase CaiB-like acyl-CoA transferase
MTQEDSIDIPTLLEGVRVLELGDELGEYCGRLLSGLGADVLKVEPPEGEITRSYGPFLDDDPDPSRSLHFWHFNLGKRSKCIDLETAEGRQELQDLLSDADVFLTSRTQGFLSAHGLDPDELSAKHPHLVYARISPFGDSGPWQNYKGSDLVHLALGGVAMNCGYDPDPFGVYDTPPTAPQMWLSYQITGEMTAFAIMGALYHRASTGRGQVVSASVHDAVSKNTENDVPNWVYLALEHMRQTCRHSNPSLSPPTICESKDGRWHMPYRTYMTSAMKNDVPNTARLLEKYGMQADLSDSKYEDPEFVKTPEVNAHVNHVVADFFARIRAEHEIWVEAQNVGLPWAPIRRPDENAGDTHWEARETFVEVVDPDSGRVFTDVGQKWVSTLPWRRPRQVPVLDGGREGWLARRASTAPDPGSRWIERPRRDIAGMSWRGSPFALAAVRIVDLSWLLASGGAGRFLAALGAEVVKVEHHSRPDHGRNSWVGRVPDPQPDAPGGEMRALNRSGSFMEINAGKLSVSLDLKQADGLELVYELVRNADAVISGFSPGTMNRLGLGYEKLKSLNPSIVMVEQSAVGSHGTYGAIRGYGPTAQAMSGLSDMSGLPEPFPPAGIGYSFLDWYGAYNMANAVMAGLLHARLTGEGCHIDASQVEAGIYLTGTAVLDRSANGRRWSRYGNRSPHKLGAPHGIYRAAGDDRWVAIACFDEDEWRAAAEVLGKLEWIEDPRFATISARAVHQDALDNLMETATRQRDPYELMAALQAAGVAAGTSQTARDRVEFDPQLKHGEWLVDLPQSDIGTWPVKEAPFTMSETPPAMGGRRHRHGPSYGEDSTDVLTRILGLPETTVNDLRERGVVG